MNKTEARTALKQDLLECLGPTGLLSSDRSLPRELSNRLFICEPFEVTSWKAAKSPSSKIPDFRALLRES
jgi:hypothetical protein